LGKRKIKFENYRKGEGKKKEGKGRVVCNKAWAKPQQRAMKKNPKDSTQNGLGCRKVPG